MVDPEGRSFLTGILWQTAIHFEKDPFHIVTSLSNRSSIEKSIKPFLKMKGQNANCMHWQNT